VERKFPSLHVPLTLFSYCSQGKATIVHPVPGDDALTVIDLPAEKDTALRRELRDMVTGLTKYDRESQKVPGN
jgi:hypothetical protein